MTLVAPRSIRAIVKHGDKMMDETRFDKEFTDESHREFGGVYSHPQYGRYVIGKSALEDPDLEGTIHSVTVSLDKGYAFFVVGEKPIRGNRTE